MALTTYKRHLNAIESGIITRTNIIGLRKIFNHIARLDRRLSGNRCNVTSAQAATLDHAIREYKPRIAGTWHDSGLAVLRNPRYAKQLRGQQFYIGRIDHFTLYGFDWIDNLHSVPIYRAHDATGSGLFKFINIPWQSGGNGPEIV